LRGVLERRNYGRRRTRSRSGAPCDGAGKESSVEISNFFFKGVLGWNKPVLNGPFSVPIVFLITGPIWLGAMGSGAHAFARIWELGGAASVRARPSSDPSKPPPLHPSPHATLLYSPSPLGALLAEAHRLLLHAILSEHRLMAFLPRRNASPRRRESPPPSSPPPRTPSTASSATSSSLSCIATALAEHLDAGRSSVLLHSWMYDSQDYA
jgi:hypothetical protein